ncbi:AP2/ERF domain-containing transcription factor [Senna tora]|uniref:AP2/ERF domain-containing transcription factor n=1 Tax=Senna tora TaxID=362788 RepID=A0A834W111_9FABA|nr:AP2/ERF domain-containing transcription factor [Senna tora]
MGGRSCNSNSCNSGEQEPKLENLVGGTGGPADTRLTSGIIAVEERAKLAKEGKVYISRSGFSRGASIYRGVTRHHQHGRWQARIGRVAGNKDVYLGSFSRKRHMILQLSSSEAVINLDMSRYDVKSIVESSSLPIAGAAKRLKDVEHQHYSNAQLMMITIAIASYTASDASSINNLYYISPAAHGALKPIIAFHQTVALAPTSTDNPPT